MAFLEGMVGGLLIDVVGIGAGYYYFPRQPFLSLEYFAIVIPCWGVFGLFINCMWQWIGQEQLIRGMIANIPLFMFYEGTNLLTGSWIYTVPFYVVALGWIPLIIVFAGCNRRRRVVFKMDTWIRQCNTRWVYILKGVRISLVVIMFPLLLVSIYKVVADLIVLKRSGISIKAYAREYLMMVDA